MHAGHWLAGVRTVARYSAVACIGCVMLAVVCGARTHVCVHHTRLLIITYCNFVIFGCQHVGRAASTRAGCQHVGRAASTWAGLPAHGQAASIEMCCAHTNISRIIGMFLFISTHVFEGRNSPHFRGRRFYRRISRPAWRCALSVGPPPPPRPRYAGVASRPSAPVLSKSAILRA